MGARHICIVSSFLLNSVFLPQNVSPLPCPGASHVECNSLFITKGVVQRQAMNSGMHFNGNSALVVD